jgi:hypothetical protein
MPVPPRPLGSGKGDHAPPCRYPLSLGKPNIIESASPGKRGRSYLKQGCSTDARSVGGWYGRWLVAIPGSGYHIDKAGEMAGKTFQLGGMSATVFCLAVSSASPSTCPRGYGRPPAGGKSRREKQQRPWDGAYGIRRRDRRATARGGFSHSLSPPISDKTELHGS